MFWKLFKCSKSFLTFVQNTEVTLYYLFRYDFNNSFSVAIVSLYDTLIARISKN